MELVGGVVMASRLVRANAVTAGDVLDGHALLAIFDAVAALLWALYASLLGYLGWSAFENAAWKGLLLALGIAFAVTGSVEGVRWRLRRRANQPGPDG
jgi:hypothetical protein